MPLFNPALEKDQFEIQSKRCQSNFFCNRKNGYIYDEFLRNKIFEPYKNTSMKCPNDNTTLVMTDRNGVEIDYCPECRGVWLDRGELDKIIERSSQEIQGNRTDKYRGERSSNSRDTENRKPKKKESFLSDLFEF